MNFHLANGRCPCKRLLKSEIILAAIGQAFFSIGVATGIMITFGAYLPENVSIPRAAATIVIADSFVSIVAGLAIFPIVFQCGLVIQHLADLSEIPCAVSNIIGDAGEC
jgi:SNF family Na+-dependent transporter